MKIDLKDRKYVTKIEEIPKIAKEISKNKHVKAVYLFGSYANGKTHVLSDIDLCIITDGKEGADYPLTDNLDISYFHRLPLTIQFRVLKDGKPLMMKDKEFIHKLKIKTLGEYLDFKHVINRYLWENFKCTI